MSKRLVTFGCSFTFGHGLPDCFEPPSHPGKIPSEYAWPSLLSKDLKIQLVNNSRCGSSNLEILHNLLKFNLLETDLIIIMWSFSDRDLIFKDNDHLTIGVWDQSDLVKNWMLVHTQEDMAIRSWFYIHHASLYLRSRKIKFYNVFSNYEKIKNYKPDFLDIDFLPYDMSEKVDYANDNLHPGVETHKIMSDKIKRVISNEFN